jgi:hypothetical protein
MAFFLCDAQMEIAENFNSKVSNFSLLEFSAYVILKLNFALDLVNDVENTDLQK